MNKIDKILDEKKIYRFEGSRGVSNLCKLVSLLGYRDPFQQGQLSDGGCFGDLICFLEDNPGAMEAVVDWIRENHDEEIEEDDEEEEGDEE